MVSIELGDPGRRKALRDYFLRLGAVAAIDEHGCVRVSVVDDDGLDLAECLGSWVDRNGAAATMLPPLPAPLAGESAR
jgi:hypothetical protein